jgi:RNA polymerase sigma-70 factor (ECF subfamily)
VFVTTWRKLPGFEDRAQIGSWLYRVTVNASLMHLRGRSRRPQFMDFGLGASALDAADTQRVVERGARLRPDEQLEAHELRRVIQRAVDKLPATLRSVFQVREIQGWSTRQAARSLGITEAAVKARLHRARLALRDEIEGYLVQ